MLLPDSSMFMLWLSWDDLLDRGRMRISAETCLGVLIRLSIGELSLFDSVLESGRKISTKGSDCEQLDNFNLVFSLIWVNKIYWKVLKRSSTFILMLLS